MHFFSQWRNGLGAEFNQRLTSVFLLGTFLSLVGTLGYMLIEGWSWQEGLFMTIITLSTVGYGEVRPLSEAGMLFSISLIVLGVGTVTYTFSVVADYIIAGELRGIWRRQRMMNDIEKLDNHYIICGYGRVGQQVIDGLVEDGKKVVVIEEDPEHVPQIESRQICYILGDASEDGILEQAGIQRARGLCTCLPSDAANVFVALSARALNPDIFLIARSNSPSSEHKLRIAGANQVINPYLIAGNRMAAQLSHPNVMEFLDVVMRRGDLELHIEEISVTATSSLAGKTLLEWQVRGETGVNVLAVHRPDGRMFTDLGDDFTMHAGDALICLGTPEQLTTLTQQTEGK